MKMQARILGPTFVSLIL